MSKMISVAEDFQYSVNIEYDLGNDDKLKNFIPTRTMLSLLEEILLSVRSNSNERARILIGAYGRGKSHIILAILSMLMKKDLILFEKLLPKLKSIPELYRLVENFYTSSNKILPVTINGTATNLNQSFLSALHRTLVKFDLLDMLPKTNFQAAVEVLRRWHKDFPKTYAAFKKLISEPVKNFINRLENFDAEAYATFEQLYPMLTAGSVFNPFMGFEAVELYESVAKSLRTKGYTGLYVVYDEFSKFLEANIGRASVSDIKMLQDFAEKANRSGELQLHLLLISHKEISNYIDKLPKEKVDGWRGVSNRFLHVRMNEDFEQTYEIISEVIHRKPKLWKNFYSRYANEFNSLHKIYSTSRIFRDVPDGLSMLIEGCFPLHPVSTFILPRLSERVAQNERTLFTFLSANGTTNLPAFLQNYRDDFTLLTPDKIYDYFEPLFRQELYTGEIHKTFLLAGRILKQMEPTTLDAKIIKTIALIYMLEQFELLAPTKEQLTEIFSCDYPAEEITRTFNELTEKNFVVYLRQSNNYLKLKQSSGVDIMQKIRDVMENLSTKFSVRDVLNAENFENVLYPSRYNTEHEMTRWFDFQFVSSEEILSGLDLDTEFSGDGIIFGVLVDDESEIERVEKIILATSMSNARCIFVLPKSFVDMRDVVLKFSAVKQLKELAEDDSVLLDEYEVIFEDLQLVIKNFIDDYTHPENFRSTYIHDGKILHVYRKAMLSELMSKICSEVYTRTPIINNEVINKNEITSIAANSRSKIIAALLRQELEPNLGLRGTGQDVSIMRSTLIRTNILIGDDNSQIDLRPKDNDYMCDLLKTIENFILDAQQNPTSFSVLYERLTSPNGHIGLRRGVIPIYLAAVIHSYRQQITISYRLKPVRTSVDTLIQINSTPEDFSIEYLDWSIDNENFVAKLAEAFADFVISAEKNLGSCDYVANAMSRWFLSLPKYSKDFNSCPDGSKVPEKSIKLRNILRQNLNGSDLLFKKLPQIFSENLTTTATQIISTKRFFDEAIDELRGFILDQTKKIFSADNLTAALRDWCTSLDPKISEQLFPDETDKFLRLIKSEDDEKTFISKLAKLATGLQIEDWNEQTPVIYFEKLTQLKTTAENFRHNETSKRQMIFVDAADNKNVKRFDSVELSPRGKLLLNQITSAFESMGQAVSVQEKRQVLIEILRTLC